MTWSHSLMLLMLVFIAMPLACTAPVRHLFDRHIAFRFRLARNHFAVWRFGRRRRRPSRAWPIADYSAKRARALAQLGDDYLLARPVNRREDVPALLRRQAG